MATVSFERAARPTSARRARAGLPASERRRPTWLPGASPAAAAAGSRDDAYPAPSPPTIYLYTKAGCPLCDGLEQKVRAALDRATFLPSPISGARLVVRRIEEDEAWAAAWAMSVPVLTLVPGRSARGGANAPPTEFPVSRPAPRAPAERVARALEEALEAAGGQ